jgi:hypothetical protein
MVKAGKIIKPLNENILKELYFNVNNSTNFSGINTLTKFLKSQNYKYNQNEIINWLRKQQVYSTHFPIRTKFKRNPIVAGHIDHNWSADLIEIRNPTYNDNYRYILMVIDVLSKFGWAEPLLDKKAETVKKAFLKIFRSTHRKPNILSTDAGKEFTNRSLKKYIKWRKIKHLVVLDQTKASIVERWNQTILNKIEKYKNFNKTKRFIDVLPQIISNYNNNVHSRTKFKPIDVNKSNEKIVYRNLYNFKQNIEIPKLKIGDYVRVFLLRGPFDKGYRQNFSKEIFRIQKMYNTSPFVKYKLKDKKGNILRGSYYSKELVKVE